jgi:hypothetical protein
MHPIKEEVIDKEHKLNEWDMGQPVALQMESVPAQVRDKSPIWLFILIIGLQYTGCFMK